MSRMSFLNEIESINNKSEEEIKFNELFDQGKYQEALNFNEKILEIDYDGTLARSGKALQALGQLEEAVFVYQRVLDSNTSGLKARHLAFAGLAQIYLEQGKPQEAIPVLEKALETFDVYAGPFEDLLKKARETVK